jgi:hypothetical protein
MGTQLVCHRSPKRRGEDLEEEAENLEKDRSTESAG